MEIKKIAVSELKYDASNARKHNGTNIAAIEKSLQEFGQQRPLVISKDNTVIAGNGTLEAARNLGWEKIEVTVFPFDDQRARAFAIADNRTAELAEWDGAQLLKDLQELWKDDLLDVSGFGDVDLQNLATIWDSPISIEDLEAPEDGADEDGLVRISFKVQPDLAAKFDQACKATGMSSAAEQAASVINLAWESLVNAP